MKGRGPHCWCGGMCYLCEGLGTGVEETRSSTSLCCAVTAENGALFFSIRKGHLDVAPGGEGPGEGRGS